MRSITLHYTTEVARTLDLEYIALHPANQNNPAQFEEFPVTPQLEK